ncbi:zinc-dependent alcohol dehydrogenase [Alloiococcus sp. CFN-8]|uniref:zinc-dependent alcohol dehydrogenase n=1 Tax=Alloiococcus sp. CFN-8 TaxID=3416081 RepID=UPI003CECFE8A
MKALKRLSDKPRDMKLVELPEPQIPSEDWIKVKVSYAGICGSDIKMFDNDCSNKNSKLKPPVIPGHEGSGVVCQVGSLVKNVKVGDRVIYHTMVGSCGHCEYCLTGNFGLCSDRKGLGSTMDGSFAEYLICPAKNVIKVPEGLSLKIAALAEPLACSIRIIEEVGKVKRGEKVVIFGPGAIGATCAIVAKTNGAIPVVVGTKHSSHRLKVLEDIGIRCMINDEKLMENLNSYFGGLADMAVDAVGKEAILNQALDSVKKLGRVVIGAGDEVNTHYKVNIIKAFRWQIQIHAACSSTPKGWYEAIKLLKENCHYFEGIASVEYSIDQWEEAYERARNRDSFKVMFKF